MCNSSVLRHYKKLLKTKIGQCLSLNDHGPCCLLMHIFISFAIQSNVYTSVYALWLIAMEMHIPYSA